MTVEMTDVTNIVTSLITLIAGIVSVFIIPLIKEKIGDAKFNKIYKWVVVAVKAYEQMAKNGNIDKEDRKQKVQEFLEKKGYILDWDEIDLMIEAAVSELPPFEDKTE